MKPPTRGLPASWKTILPASQRIRAYLVRCPATRAFSLVELLVTITILSLSMAFLLPAVQMAREAGRRASCVNNLKQLALAAHAYHTSKNCFPVVRPTGEPPGKFWGHMARLLPHLDQIPLSTQIDLNKPINATALATVAAEPLPVFLCPSDINRMTNLADPLALVGYSKSNYRGNGGNDTGEIAATGAEKNNGIFRVGQKLCMEQIVNGVTNTALFSESLLGDGDDEMISKPGDWFVVPSGNYSRQSLYAAALAVTPEKGAGDQYSYAGNCFATGDYTVTRYTHLMPPNTVSLVVRKSAHDLAEAINANAQATTASSRHPGGVNVAMADGSVRFVQNDVGVAVWWGLGSVGGH